VLTQEFINHLKNQKPQIDVLGQWVYLPNARTGSTSITGGLLSDRVIMHQRGEKNWERVWNKVIVPRIDEVTIFTFVRNPWDRAVSSWRVLQEKGRISRQSFPEFMGNGKVASVMFDHFFKPQTDSFMCGGVEIPGIIIGRHENRQDDWWRIASEIGVAAPLPHHNATEHEPYWEYYTPKTVEVVGRLYATEIEALGYEFGQ
jgi:hypothetical protein